jgi:hypothetical protein
MFECAGGRYSSLVLERGGVWNEVVWFSKGVLAGNDGPFDFEMLLVCSSARIDHVVFAINLSRTFVPLISSPHENMPTRLGPTLAASRFGTTSRIKTGSGEPVSFFLARQAIPWAFPCDRWGH